MAGIILLLLIIVLLVFIAYSKNRKVALLISLLILLSYHLYVSYQCGPNKKDVAVMKPMAEAISNYIVKNGIPKSLKDIPGLPYELECKEDNGNSCYFVVNGNHYSISYSVLASGTRILGSFAAKSRTGYQIEFAISEENKTLINKKNSGAYSMKNTGICNPMKQ